MKTTTMINRKRKMIIKFWKINSWNSKHKEKKIMLLQILDWLCSRSFYILKNHFWSQSHYHIHTYRHFLKLNEKNYYYCIQLLLLKKYIQNRVIWMNKKLNNNLDVSGLLFCQVEHGVSPNKTKKPTIDIPTYKKYIIKNHHLSSRF